MCDGEVDFALFLYHEQNVLLFTLVVVFCFGVTTSIMIIFKLCKIPVFPFADHLFKEINVVNNIHHHFKQPDLFFMHVPECLNKKNVHYWAGDNSHRYV